ncbi:hypothetical protein J003_05921 [Cryptococcus neoformans]|nr:hypothetical protein J003_05921 [Cryptococcus neoformans var. grubii]
MKYPFADEKQLTSSTGHPVQPKGLSKNER